MSLLLFFRPHTYGSPKAVSVVDVEFTTPAVIDQAVTIPKVVDETAK